jgi:UDP-glucuronate 4-epimerase
MRVLVTGTAGFIGNALALQLLARGDEVAGLDNVNAYYDVRLKEARLARVTGHPAFTEARIALEDQAALEDLFRRFRPQRVVHLAAQAGVRHSLDQPRVYVTSNVMGFTNILEGCRHGGVEHLVFASTSSVYGLNTHMPFSVQAGADHPISLYAATKRANELMAHAYSHLFGLPATGLRFFTVYGPWGRPDMALFKFTRAILAGEPIDLYNRGDMRRDFTYVDDIVEGVVRVLDRPPGPDPAFDAAFNTGRPDPSRSTAPYRLYNIGNHNPVELGHFVAALERALDRTAVKRYLPLQPGDVPATYADVADLERDTGFRPATTIEDGIGRFVAWYKTYYP